jgi:HPt (histidine-containing phosphotransfer) domain-containing protein
MGGSQSRYRELLGTFRRDVEAGFALLENTPDNANRSSFTTLVHSLKSALATIGANSLSQSAAVLEEAARAGEFSRVCEKLGSFRSELAALIERIVDALSVARPETESHADAALEIETLYRLKDALDKKAIDAIDDALMALQASPLGVGPREEVARISDLVLTADFQGAASAVSRLIAKEEALRNVAAR